MRPLVLGVSLLISLAQPALAVQRTVLAEDFVGTW